MKLCWETLDGQVGRGAIVFALVFATTFGGYGTQRAAAANATPQKLVHRADPQETVFAFGDDLDAVNYQLAFVPDARDDARLAAACRAVFADQPGFEAALRSAKAEAVASDLAADAEPTIEACFAPQSTDTDAAERAAEGFAEFHDRAFDFAAR